MHRSLGDHVDGRAQHIRGDGCVEPIHLTDSRIRSVE